MQKGELVEQGTHQQLIEKGGVYADLVKKQEIAIKKEETQETQVDEETLLQQEKMDIQNQMEEQLSRVVTNVSEKESIIMMRRKSSVPTVDAFELKLQRQKELKKKGKKQGAPIFKVLKRMRPEWPLMILGCLGAAVAGVIFPMFAFLFSQTIVILTDPTKKYQIDQGPVQGTNLYAFCFVILALGGLFGMSVQTISFEVAGERFTRRFRADVFRAYMRQEVGFFDQDENNMGALTTKLAVDAKNVNELVTKTWGDFLQVIATAVTGMLTQRTSIVNNVLFY